jgi:hypothetical protein
MPSLTLREEQCLKVFDKRMLQDTWPQERNWQETGQNLINYLYRPPNTMRVLNSQRKKWVGHAARM